MVLLMQATIIYLDRDRSIFGNITNAVKRSKKINNKLTDCTTKHIKKEVTNYRFDVLSVQLYISPIIAISLQLLNRISLVSDERYMT